MMNLAGCIVNSQHHPTSIPQLRRVGQTTQLFVDDKPFLALGGELGNSTASNLEVLEQAFAKCEHMNLNTVMLPVYWDLIEPSENHFDFSLVQGAIDRARAHHLHLVYLWFGTWKNSMSCYAPSWIKRDVARFPRVRLSNGELEEIVTPECTASRDADANAFASLMRWTRQYDSGHHTVIMVQVENEVGMIPEPRDHSELSNSAYHSPVPEKLLALAAQKQLGPEINMLWQNAGHKTAGTWPEVFGDTAQGEEIFTAWQLASYVEHIAAAGKREYPLPMFANAALIRPGYFPGQYPSGGPLPHLLEIWRAAAPSLDMICPDIYFPNFIEWATRYKRNGNPLFIPEMAASDRAPANILYAISQLHAIGTGPFSIENLDGEKAQRITQCYGLLAGMSDSILKAQQTNKIIGLSPPIAFDWSTSNEPQRADLGGITFQATFDRPGNPNDSARPTTLPTLGSGHWDAPPNTPRGSALILQLAHDEFLILGMGATITFSAPNNKIGIDSVQEGHFTDDDK
ncbi:MAG TPA: DUF5597 domain-containing protein [Tepidisphaeraceae bacterium]